MYEHKVWSDAGFLANSASPTNDEQKGKNGGKEQSNLSAEERVQYY